MNDIGAVSLHLLRPIAVDLYRENRGTGALILIDPETNATVAAGMITAAKAGLQAGDRRRDRGMGPVTAGERKRAGDIAAAFWSWRAGGTDRRCRALAVCRWRGDQPHRCRRARRFCFIRDCIDDRHRHSGAMRACCRWWCATRTRECADARVAGGVEITLDADEPHAAPSPRFISCCSARESLSLQKGRIL